MRMRKQAIFIGIFLWGCWTTGGGPDGPEPDAMSPAEMDARVSDVGAQMDVGGLLKTDGGLDLVDVDVSAVVDGSVAVDAGPSDMPSIEINSVQVGEWVFDVRMAGPMEGDPVIFLHGFPQTSLEFEAQILALADVGYRVIAPNQRGYSPGARPTDEAAYLLPNLVGDINGIADALGYDRYHVVGHDWGAMVAWSLGINYPERLYSLTAISVPHPQPFQETRNDSNSCQFAASMYFGFFIQPNSHELLLANDAFQLRALYAGLPEHHIDDYLAVLTQENALKHALDWYRANVGDDAPEVTFDPVTVPTLYVWGDEDSALCEDGAYLTENYVTGPYHFEIFEGIDHWVPEMAAERLSSRILDHLSAYPAPGGR